LLPAALVAEALKLSHLLTTFKIHHGLREHRQTDRQKPAAPSCCRSKRLFSSSLMTISRLHGDRDKRNRKLILAAGLTTGKLLR